MAELGLWGGSSHDALDVASSAGPSEPVHLRDSQTRTERPSYCTTLPGDCLLPSSACCDKRHGQGKEEGNVAFPPLGALAPPEPRGTTVS